jgi:choline-glycine betaine transporter
MLGEVAIVWSLLVALYTGNPQAWTVFYLAIGISFVVFSTRFIAHRRKFGKLV